MSTPIEENLYRAPAARVEDAPTSESTQQYYVVSPRKFLILMIGTLGVYHVYWFYKHWAQLDRTRKRYWPVARTAFSIFFTHSLFSEIRKSLVERHIVLRWAPLWTATIYVAATVVEPMSALLGLYVDLEPKRFEGAVAMQGAAWLLFAAAVWAVYRAQRAANMAVGDPGGTSNDRITDANVIWLLAGAAFWALQLFNAYVYFTDPLFDLSTPPHADFA